MESNYEIKTWRNGEEGWCRRPWCVQIRWVNGVGRGSWTILCGCNGFGDFSTKDEAIRYAKSQIRRMVNTARIVESTTEVLRYDA